MNQIKKIVFVAGLVMFLGISAPKASADSPSLQDLGFNINGTWTHPGSPAPSGVDLSAYSTSSGLGTITFTSTTLGSNYFNAWWDVEVGTPYYNEYGSTSGAASSGQSWEIGDNYGSNIYNDASGGSLTNQNYLPLGSDNFFASCIAANVGDCAGYNGDATTALGYAFTLSSGNEEVITLTVSQTAPASGFYLQQTNPNEDSDNSGIVGNVYFSESAQQIPVGSQPPPVVPEPSTWVLLLSGVLILAWTMRRQAASKSVLRVASLLTMGALVSGVTAKAQQVVTVPWDPTNPAAPHTAYPGAKIVLGAVFTGGVSGHSYTYSWNYGDGSPVTAPASITNPNDISSSHIYSGVSPGVTTWTAVVTVNDTTASLQYSGNYLVIWENNTLQSRVNAAIDWGLWYLHQNMYHPSATTGTWRQCAPGYSYSCGTGYGSLDANNVQAFEVNGHLATGPATDPYSADVAEGIADMLPYLGIQSVQSKTYTFNPATANFGCSNGTSPTSTNSGSPSFYCTPPATPVFYEPGSTSCGAPPCMFTFDGNGNGQAIFAFQSGQSWGYEDGMYADSLVASGKPTLSAATGNSLLQSYTGTLSTESFKDIVQDIVDAAAYCQYGSDPYDVSSGYVRGGYPYQGGGWWYNCQTGDDNSVSQWAAIGLIAGNRGFGITIPPIVTDANNMWVTASQNVQSADVQSTNSGTAGNVDDPSQSYTNAYDYGGFGYNGSLYYSDAWGPWAVTPSGMVQMALDGIGRTQNTAFGDASNAADQRFNNAETYYADNFCNPLTGPYAGATYTPRNYTYGLFSFTKSMLLHNPGGVLTPIQYLRTQTPNVFTTNTSVPPNTIDWYAALSPANGGTDPCDGVAQTIVGRQAFPGGYWNGDNYTGSQDPYETAWSLIMLQKSVFVACVNNLGGAGTSSGTNPARIDLTWTGIPTATSYNILRSTSNGGPYVDIGTSTTNSYSDRTGLLNGDTYYYVLQPTNGTGTPICQSNQATISVPKPRTR